MHVIFEQVKLDVTVRCRDNHGEEFAGYDGMPIDFFELFFADETTFAAQRASTEALLQSVEAISAR